MFGPSPDAVEAIRGSAERMHSYPKASHADLVDELADMWDVTPEQVWLSNGGDGALDCLARAMLDPGQDVLVPSPGFAYYAMSARYHHGEVTSTRSRRPTTSTRPPTPSSTPTTASASSTSRAAQPDRRGVPDRRGPDIAEAADEQTLVVVDEAYGEFAEKPGHRPLSERDDVAVLRTFSKAYGLAGIRSATRSFPRTGPMPTPASTRRSRPANSPAAPGWRRSTTTSTSSAPSTPPRGPGSTSRRNSTHRPGTARGTSSSRRSATRRPSRSRSGAWRHHRDCLDGLPECIRITCGTREDTERAVSVLLEELSE